MLDTGYLILDSGYCKYEKGFNPCNCCLLIRVINNISLKFIK
jgi:hypothetical protein